MTLNLNEILNCVSGKLILKGKKEEFSKISIDTRSILDQEIFLAIRGENFDGNKYILDAIKKGIKLCIIDKKYFDDELFKDFDISIILVENTLKALENLAIYVRSKLDIEIIAVTGSVGKTTTKDLIYDFLVSKYKVYKILGNFNNHIGMPLSLVNIDDDSEIAVFELGMSNIGEIDYLSKILKPKIGVITNIGESHIGFLKTRENILKAKMEIINYFDNDNILILNNEDDLLKNISCTYRFKVYKVGFSEYCDFFAKDVEIDQNGIKFKIIYNGKNEEVKLPILGKHNVLNSLIAFKICEIFKIPIDLIKNRFGLLNISDMRQEILNYKNMIIINDCYNASPTSMKSSIDVLNLYSKEKVCILGDMAELGENSKMYHNEISEYANGKIDKLIAIGKYRKFYCEKFNDKNNCFCFETVDDFYCNLKNIFGGNEAVLIKASRSSKFETILSMIKEKI